MPLATFHQNERLGEIVIDNPPQNLFGGALLTDLGAALDEAADHDIRALLVRAEGDDFSAGAEVSVFIGLDEEQARQLETTVVSLIAAIEDLPVPTVALIQGQCYAGALEVCLSCDLIWAAEGSQIGQIEAVAGSIPYAGGTQRIASRIRSTVREQPLRCRVTLMGSRWSGGWLHGVGVGSRFSRCLPKVPLALAPF